MTFFVVKTNMKLNEMYQVAKQKGKQDICRFMRDMKKHEFKMQSYNGRNFWAGPAVVVGNIQEVLSNTHVKCQWDNMGMDFVVYPEESL